MRIGWTIMGIVTFSAVLFSTLPCWMRAKGDGYNFASYQELDRDTEYRYVSPNQHFPATIHVFDLDGQKIALSSLWQKKPLVLAFGCKSCPITFGSQTTMAEIYRSFNNEVNFALLYVREAHPGLVSPPHRSIEQKLRNAAGYKKIHQIPQDVFVDSLDGNVHRTAGLGPNSVYVIGTDGVVSHFAYWNQPEDLTVAVEGIIQSHGLGQHAKKSASSCQTLLPELWSEKLKSMLRIFYTGGPDAFFDFLLNGLKQAKQSKRC